MSPRVYHLLWEVLVRAGFTPTRAALWMAGQGRVITVAEASRELVAAGGRNDLKLVSVDDLQKKR